MSIAETVIAKCGGVARTAEITQRTQSAVYRWTYPKDRGGTGGTVPVDAQQLIMAAARAGVVDISAEDFFAKPEAAE